MKDEEWGGAFVDHFEDRVPAKAFLGLSWRSLRLVSLQIYIKYIHEHGMVVGGRHINVQVVVVVLSEVLLSILKL